MILRTFWIGPVLDFIKRPEMGIIKLPFFEYGKVLKVMSTHQAHREWGKLQNEQVQKVRRGEDSFFSQCKELLKLTDEEGSLLMNRQGYVLESSPDPVEICQRTILLSNVEGFSKRILLRVTKKPVGFNALDRRLIKKYRLDGIIRWSPKQEDTFELLELDIKDSCLQSTSSNKTLETPQFYEHFDNKLFQKRESKVKFELKAFDTTQDEKLALLVHLNFPSRTQRNHSSPPGEFRSLCKTLDFGIGDQLSQPVRKIHPATYMGTGKYQELLGLLEEQEYSHVLFNCDLPANAKRKLEEESLITVFDRTDLILEIFNQHARSKRARVQVELAQLRFRMEDLIRKQMDSQQFVSAKAYESYQDKLRSQFTSRRKDLELELEKLRAQDSNRMQSRLKENPTSLALVGYTNAGKSTLFNQFLGREEVEAQDFLFKTLDTTTRTLEITTHSRLLISDTVGFIQEIPKHLMEAFYTTLAESRSCSHLLVLLDARGIDIQEQLDCIRKAMKHIDREDEENWILVLNKVDLLSEAEQDEIRKVYPFDFELCAKEEESVAALKDYLIQRICTSQTQIELTLSYEDFSNFHKLKEFATILSEPEYLPDGVKILFSYSESDAYKIDQLFGDSDWRSCEPTS